MNHATLNREPTRTVLADLFAAAERNDASLRARFAALSPAEQAALHADYRQMYAVHARTAYLPVSRTTGELLYLLARAVRPKVVVEFGTSFGISTIFLAAALRDVGGGRVIGTELSPEKAERARANVAAAGLADVVEIREGDALDSLARDLPGEIGLVLLDGAKVLYARILDLLEPSLIPGAIVVADNADLSPEARARLRTSGSYLALPLSEDVELAQWLGCP
jgi:predicted O-methyltransferase YrrM